MKKIIFYTLLLGSLASCNNTKNLKEDAVFDPRYAETDSVSQKVDELLLRADRVFMYANYLVELYTQNTAGEMQKVDNFDAIDRTTLKATYNIIRYEDGNIMFAAEFPYVPDSPVENIYTSVFSEAGNLLLFMRTSGFRDRDAAEKSEYLYSEKHKLLRKTYELTDGKGTLLDRKVKISFPERLPYKQFDTRKAWLKAQGLAQ
jgi:hypothetical protein